MEESPSRRRPSNTASSPEEQKRVQFSLGLACSLVPDSQTSRVPRQARELSDAVQRMTCPFKSSFSFFCAASNSEHRWLWWKTKIVVERVGRAIAHLQAVGSRRLPVLRCQSPCGAKHRAESADRKKQVSTRVIQGPGGVACRKMARRHVTTGREEARGLL